MEPGNVYLSEYNDLYFCVWNSTTHVGFYNIGKSFDIGNAVWVTASLFSEFGQLQMDDEGSQIAKQMRIVAIFNNCEPKYIKFWKKLT